MAESPLVSVVVTTRNSAPTLQACLDSIRSQTYPNLELIVVDNHSTDGTPAIAARYTEQVQTAGPERSAQRNAGAASSSGEYVYFVDADFVLDREVVAQCVREALRGNDAVIVHNSPDASVSWIARIRKFEVDMYKYDLAHSAARFFRKDVFEALGGYNPRVTAGEDYDIQNRLTRGGYRVGYADAEALHLGEPTSIVDHLRKYYEYGKDFVHYRAANRAESGRQLAFLRPVYLRHWKRFLSDPLTGAAFAAYHTAKFLSGALGYASGRLRGATEPSPVEERV